MKKKDAKLEAETYARTVATFFSEKPLEGLLVAAFLSGYRLCEARNNLDDEYLEAEMKKQAVLFDWMKSDEKSIRN